jgi:hypothetical protein
MLGRIAAVVAALTLLTAAAANAAGAPIEGSLRLAPIRAADPFGGPAYTFGTYRATLTLGGRTIPIWCTENLRLDGNQLGTVDPTGAFASTTLEQAAASGENDGPCGGGLPMTWITSSAGPGPRVTLDGGWFGAGVTSVTIQQGGRWKPVPFTADGAFLVALPGGWADGPNAAGAPVLPLVRVTATLCGPHARRDLLHVGDTTRTGACELTSYLPTRQSLSARALHQRKRRIRR